jgi:hypothetical protein
VTNTLSARLIGAIFLERGLVTEEQLQAALALQVQTKEHLGEILVQHFGVSRIELASVLAEQWAELERANADSAEGEAPATNANEISAEPRHADGHGPKAEGAGQNGEDGDEEKSPRPLGEILAEQGLVTDAELDRALETQRDGGQKLGEILVAQGSITRLQLASALAEQWTALRKIRPPSASQPQMSSPPATSREEPPTEFERLNDAVGALEQRLRAAENAAASEPWREEISAASEGLQASIAEIETRLGAAATREELEAVEAMRSSLDELAGKVETISSGDRRDDPELLRRVETAAEAATAARSSLDGAFELLSLRLADVESRVHDRSDITRLQSELEGLAQRVADFDGERESSEVDELRGEVQRLLDEVSRRTAASSEPDPALAKRVEQLTVRVEEIGGALKGFDGSKKSSRDADALREAMAALAARIQKLEAGGSTDLQELRRSLSELEARVPIDSPLADRLAHYGTGPDEIHALQERLGEIEQQTAELAARRPELEDQVGALGGRLEALEGSTVGDELDALRGSVDRLEARPVADPALAEHVAQIAARLEEVAAESTQIDELRARVERLAAEAGRVGAVVTEVEAVRSQLGWPDELGSRLHAVETGGRSPRSFGGEVAAPRLALPVILSRRAARRVEEKRVARRAARRPGLGHRLDLVPTGSRGRPRQTDQASR